MGCPRVNDLYHVYITELLYTTRVYIQAVSIYDMDVLSCRSRKKTHYEVKRLVALTRNSLHYYALREMLLAAAIRIYIYDYI